MLTTVAQEWDGLPMAFQLKCGKIPRANRCDFGRIALIVVRASSSN